MIRRVQSKARHFFIRSTQAKSSLPSYQLTSKSGVPGGRFSRMMLGLRERTSSWRLWWTGVSTEGTLVVKTRSMQGLSATKGACNAERRTV